MVWDLLETWMLVSSIIPLPQPPYLSAEPDGPPMDVILQPVTSQSIRVTWKVKL